MSKLGRYLRLRRYIKNWRKYSIKGPRRDEVFTYETRGRTLKFNVTSPFFDVFEEIFIEDFYGAKKLCGRLPSDALIVDVGANAGFFSFLCLSELPNAKIYAFEPMPVNVALMQLNISLNKKLEQQLLLSPMALTGDHTGPMEMFHDTQTNNPIIASVYKDFAKENNDACTVQALSLADFIATYAIDTIDLLKLDCEGSEFPIIYNSPDSVWQVVKGMAIEVHDLDDDTRNTSSVTRFLESKGYEIQKSVGKNGCASLSAFKHPSSVRE